MEQSNEKLTEFTSNLKYKIEATAPDSNHLRIVRRHDNGESHIDLMTGRVVMLANQKYTIIKYISEHTEQTIYGYSPNTHVQPIWDYDLTYTTGDTDYTIVATVEDAYFIFHNNIGLITIGSVVRLQNGKDAIITGIEYNFSSNIAIHGKTVDGSYILKWNRDGKNKSFITPDADIASVVTRNFRGGFPVFENFQTTTVSATNKEQAIDMGTEDAPEFGLKALPINELDIKLGSQVKLTNGRVAFTGRIPSAKNPYHYYFVELPGGRERKVDIRPDHRADNLVGVAQVLCGPERLTEYYFDFSKIEEGNTYSYISNGMAQTKTYHNDDTDVLNASNPLVFDTRFLAVWRLNEFKRVLSATGDISVETKREDERKYEILPEPIVAPNGEVCHRIKALKDIPVIDVKKGDLGGCVSNATSLSHSGSSWIFEGGFVVGNAIVEDDAIVGDGALVGDTACISGTAAICKGVVVDSNAQVGGDVVVRHGNIGNGAIVTKQYHYLYVDNVNGRGDECTIYLTEGAIGASVGGCSGALWQALCLKPEVACITSPDLMQTYVRLFADNSRG
nr:MAG TPA: Putative transferase, nesg, ydcK, Structural Genomics.38A [Caudoviricetes sp.]